MILKSRYMALRVIPVAVVLLAASAGFATHAAAAAVFFVSPYGDDSNPCTAVVAPCLTVTRAISVSAPGDTIRLAAGDYVEQVTLTSSRTIVGAGQDNSTIAAPATLALNGQSPAQYAIVDISGSTTTVTMSKLTVAGPAAAGAELDKGIDVWGSATLNLSSAAVRNVHDLPASGAQHGDGISVGGPCFSCADVGHATLTNVTISIYQKNGIAVRGAGSTLNMSGGRVTASVNPKSANNGIEIVSGAVGVVNATNVSGNECNSVSGGCGNDPFTQTQASGVLAIGAGAGTMFTGMTVHGNDMGMYTDGNTTFSGDNASSNRHVGIFVDSGGAGGATVSNDTANRVGSVGQYGIITFSGAGNTFSNDTAHLNSAFDLDADSSIIGSDTNTYSSNHSTHASPSKAYWSST